MATPTISRPVGFPVFDEFFKPLNEWFERSAFFGKTITVPPVNIMEKENSYELVLAAPGMKKEDFNLAFDGTMLTISSVQEESKEKKEQTFTRREFNFFTFSRSFTLPEDVKAELIEAKYEDGLLKIILPRKEEAKRTTANRQIAVK